MRVMMSGSNGRSRSSICSNFGRSNTSRRSSSNQKINQWGQASTPVAAVGAAAVTATAVPPAPDFNYCSLFT